MSLHQVNSPSAGSMPTFEQWITDGTLVYLEQLKHAATLAPASHAIQISVRIAALRKLTAQYVAVFNVCTSPLLRLPRELLERIFSCVAACEHVQKWMKLGQVCSALRDALLGFRWLWGDAVCSWVDIMSSWNDGRHRDKLLERAGPSAPLRLYVTGGRVSSDAVDFALAHLTRARVLRASDLSFFEWFVQNKEPSRLPCLERVELEHYNYKSPSATTHPPRKTPRLAYVKLTNVLWNFCPSTLTTLNIEHSRTTSKYSPSQLHDLLRQSLRLQNLKLHDCLPFLSDDMVSEGTVSFPYMRVLEVDDKRECALQLWRLLSIPSDAKVIVALECDTQTTPLHPDYTGPPCFQDSALFKHHLRGRQISSLAVLHKVTAELAFAIHSRPEQDSTSSITSSTCHKFESQATLELAYKGCFGDYRHRPLDPDSQRKNALLQVCAEHGLFDVARLTWLASEFQSIRWVSALNNFVNVEYLEVKRPSSVVYAVLGSLSTRKFLNLDDLSFMPLPFPKLRELIPSNAYVYTSRHRERNRSRTTDLLDIIRSRSVQGHPLEVLRFRGITVESAGYKEETTTFLDELRSHFPCCCVEALPPPSYEELYDRL